MIIRSGGQSGVDRAALDTARRHGIPVCGWCPGGGWAEDCPEPPGVRALFPELQETPLGRVEQRTVWNVRDSDATLTVEPLDSGASPGTDLTRRAARIFRRPLLTVHSVSDVPLILDWCRRDWVLNVGGPRASEWPRGYAETCALLSLFFTGLGFPACGN